MTIHCELSDVDDWLRGQTPDDFTGEIPSGLIPEQEITEEGQ
jgi:hypothetical protein